MSESACTYFQTRVRTLYISQVCQGLKRHCCPPSESHSDWCRVVIEKPFGRDLASARLLGQELHALFAEPQIYRMDHFLGKEVSQVRRRWLFALAMTSLPHKRWLLRMGR